VARQRSWRFAPVKIVPRKGGGVAPCAVFDGAADASDKIPRRPAAKGNAMPTYVVLSNFTDQGIRNIKDTPKRAEAFKAMAQQHGCTVKEILWTHGHYDVVTIIDAPDEASASALGLSVAKLGNIRSHTLRAFSAEEITKILDKVA
jgi:uncharacterized protein with GYD domain